MSYRVAIRCNETGEVRFHEVPDYDWNEGQEFMWTDGNFGCDCNRSIFFGRAGGETLSDVCGDTRFSCLYAELPDGSKREVDTVND